MSILNKLDRVFLKSRRARKKPTSHYPTNASCVKNGKVYGTCLRQQWYTWKGAEETNPDGVVSVFRMMLGNVIHEIVQNFFSKYDPETEEVEKRVKETPIGLENPVSGRIDIVHREHGELIGAELKTSYGQGIENIKRFGIKDDHILQVLCYLSLDPEIQKFELVYLARDSFYRTSFIITSEMCKEIYGFTWQGIIERWVILEKHINNNALPVADFIPKYSIETRAMKYKEYRDNSRAKKPQTAKEWDRKHTSDWQCNYCKYKDRCLNEKG